MSVKKFVEDSNSEGVRGKDIIQKGDWILKWNPGGDPGTTGFSLFTPPDFDPEAGNGPVGGLILAAVYFMLEHGDREFADGLIKQANGLAGEIQRHKEQQSSMKSPAGRILN